MRSFCCKEYLLFAKFAAKGVVLGFTFAPDLNWKSAEKAAASGTFVGIAIWTAIAPIICPMYILWQKFKKDDVDINEVATGGAFALIPMAVVGLIIGTVVGSIAQPGSIDLIKTIGVVLMTGLYAAIPTVIVGCVIFGVIWLLCIIVDFLYEIVDWLFDDIFLPLTVGLGVSVGMGFILGFHNPFILLALAGTALPLVTMLLYPQFKHRRLIAKYRKSEQHLIQP